MRRVIKRFEVRNKGSEQTRWETKGLSEKSLHTKKVGWKKVHFPSNFFVLKGSGWGATQVFFVRYFVYNCSLKPSTK